MASARTIRRRLLREAAEENYATMHGQPAPSVRRRRRFRRVARWGLTLGVLAAVGGASWVLASRGYLRPAPPEQGKTVLLVPPPAPRPASASSPAVSTDGVETQWARAALPFNVRRVMIDAGHGGVHRGTAASSGLAEKTITLDVAKRLAQLLEADGFEVAMTREEDETVTLTERGDIANQIGADLFISIHVNWYSEPDVRAVETYYLGPTDEPEIERLAARENLESDLPLGQFRQALEKVYADVRRSESRQFALAIQQELLKSLQTINPWVEDRGVRSAPFGVLVRTKMPAILAEVGCLSNEEEAKLLERESYRAYIAEALHSGIRRYAEELNPTRGS